MFQTPHKTMLHNYNNISTPQRGKTYVSLRTKYKPYLEIQAKEIQTVHVDSSSSQITLAIFLQECVCG